MPGIDAGIDARHHFGRQSLTGDLAGLYKLRVGDYRVIYEVLAREATIIIHAGRLMGVPVYAHPNC